jgi:hypothetical protein
MANHRDKPASDLAHGPVKGCDIERVRRNVEETDARSVRAEEASVARHRQRVAGRMAQHGKEAPNLTVDVDSVAHAT